MATDRWSSDRFRPPQLSDGVIQSVRLRDKGADSYVEPIASSSRDEGNAFDQPLPRSSASRMAADHERAQADRVAAAVAMSAVGRDNVPSFGLCGSTVNSNASLARKWEHIGETSLLPPPPSGQLMTIHSTRRAEPSAAVTSRHLPDQPTRQAAEHSGQHKAQGETTQQVAADSAVSTATKQTLTKSERRRQQCRANQARYRNKQRALRIELTQSLDRLRGEVQELEVKRHTLSRRSHAELSAWNIVVNYFRLFRRGVSVGARVSMPKEDLGAGEEAPPAADNVASQFLKTTIGEEQLTFLRSVMDPEVCLLGSKTHGVDALLSLWVRWSRCVSAFELELERVENVRSLPSTLKATVRVSVTIPASAVRDLFPHLFASRRGNDSDADLARRLGGQRLEFGYAMWFEFDPRSSRVVRLRSQLNLISELLRVVESLSAVARALDGSRLTAEGFLLLSGNGNGTQSPNSGTLETEAVASQV